MKSEDFKNCEKSQTEAFLENAFVIIATKRVKQLRIGAHVTLKTWFYYRNMMDKNGNKIIVNASPLFYGGQLRCGTWVEDVCKIGSICSIKIETRSLVETLILAGSIKITDGTNYIDYMYSGSGVCDVWVRKIDFNFIPNKKGFPYEIQG